MAVYPICSKEEKEVGQRCLLCERKYTNKRKPVPAIIGYATNKSVLAWKCKHYAGADENASKYPTAIGVEDAVNWRGEFWERYRPRRVCAKSS